MPTRCLWCVLPWLLATALMPVQAGQACDARPPSLKTIERGMALADKVSQALDGSGARVVVLARAGQDLGPYGLRYSHVGFAYKTPQGPWRVLH